MTAPGSEGIAPLSLEDPQAFMSELSGAEMSCLSENVDPQRLMALVGSPDLATPDETAELMQCLEDDTLLRLFLTGLIGETGSLSEETSMCVRAGFEDIDLRSVMLASSTGAEDGAAAMMTGMVGMFLTLSCLNEEEWQSAAPALGMGPDDRESLQCVLEELGGPEGFAASLDPDAGPPVALLSAAMSCGMETIGQPGG